VLRPVRHLSGGAGGERARLDGSVNGEGIEEWA
jgi:hypothetical protein